MSQEPEIVESLKERLQIYHKLATLYKWSWSDFCSTPWPVIKGLCSLLDETKEDMQKFISWDEYGEYRNLLRLHGSSDKKD